MMTYKKTSLETIDDSKEDNIQQPHFYLKNSMDRFGDDMFGLILSYLSLEDRFQCECVSKQFQRTVFGSVVAIDITDKLIRRILSPTIIQTKYLMTIAIKCPNIQIIECRGIQSSEEHIPEVLNTFRDNCQHLREIYYNLRSNDYQWLTTFGSIITRIGSVSAKQSLVYCHRLSHLSVTSISDVFNNHSVEIMAKNLLRFEYNFDLREDNIVLLSTFVTYNQSLQSLAIKSIHCQSQDTIAELIQQLSRLPQLRQLTLELSTFGQKLNDFLPTIGVNCYQLKRLSLELVSQTTELIGQTLDSLELFGRLRRLELKVRFDDNCLKTIGNQSLDLLIPGKRLTHLSINCRQINYRLFENCHELWPRLQYLSIDCRYFNVKFLDHILGLPELQMLSIYYTVNDINTRLINHAYKDLLSLSPKLKTIEIHM